jgi:hypothetical protein
LISLQQPQLLSATDWQISARSHESSERKEMCSVASTAVSSRFCYTQPHIRQASGGGKRYITSSRTLSVPMHGRRSEDQDRDTR